MTDLVREVFEGVAPPMSTRNFRVLAASEECITD